jgi:N-acetylglutamate synthase-like GNAT family acetyltransferase
MIYRKTTFEHILPVWENNLWPGRKSAIETHSVMTWPWSEQPRYDMSIFEYPATFWCATNQDKVIAVISGHKTSQKHYRTRGIWVDSDHRLRGISQMLFLLVGAQAKLEHCNKLWSLPKQSAIRAYTKAGFITEGDYFVTEMSVSNIYAQKNL